MNAAEEEKKTHQAAGCQATELVMTNNVFQMDDTFWLQLMGTAMGTNAACMFATICFSHQEETKLLPKYTNYTKHTAAPLMLGNFIFPGFLL